jgi:hypothetical protein
MTVGAHEIGSARMAARESGKTTPGMPKPTADPRTAAIRRLYAMQECLAGGRSSVKPKR